jgi:hypothetical protein
MKSLLNAIAAIVGAYIPAKQVETGFISGNDFKQEHPSVAIARAEAKEKMKQWGRKTMLEGGKFSRNHTVLRASQTMN